MAGKTGIALLSALRKAGSIKSLGEVPEIFFIDEDEKLAFAWLREHVSQHKSFPDPAMFATATGIQTVNTLQKLSYYIDEGRKRVLYQEMMGPFGSMNEGMKTHDPDAVMAFAKQIVSLGT